jgi:hypothetical protein
MDCVLGLRARVNHVLTMQVANPIANQIAVKIIQTGANDGGNLRPFCIVVKAINHSASNDRDNLVGLWIGDEALKSHISLGATRWDATTKTASGPAMLRAASASKTVATGSRRSFVRLRLTLAAAYRATYISTSLLREG